VKSEEVETGWSNLKTNMAESPREGYGSTRAVLPMMIQILLLWHLQLNA
jgi:hypothetical protein